MCIIIYVVMCGWIKSAATHYIYVQLYGNNKINNYFNLVGCQCSGAGPRK